MSKGLRLSEKWFNRGLWLIAIIFASFLIGLGGAIIGDLPQVEKNYTIDDFLISQLHSLCALIYVKLGAHAQICMMLAIKRKLN